MWIWVHFTEILPPKITNHMICNTSMQIYLSSSFHLSRIPLEWQRSSSSYCRYGNRRTWKRMSDYFKSTDCQHFQLCSFYGHWVFYISGVCCVAMVTSVLHPHCLQSNQISPQSCVHHHYICNVPSQSIIIVMHCCHGENVCSSDSRHHEE